MLVHWGGQKGGSLHAVRLDPSRKTGRPSGVTSKRLPAPAALDNIADRLYSYMAMNKTEARLDQVFSALADPTRRALLARLAQGEATVSELARPFGLRQPTISKHLRVLEDAGLIGQGRDAQRRPRTLVVGGPLEHVDQWLKPFRDQWERRFDRLDALLERKKSKHDRAKGDPT